MRTDLFNPSLGNYVDRATDPHKNRQFLTTDLLADAAVGHAAFTYVERFASVPVQGESVARGVLEVFADQYIDSEVSEKGLSWIDIGKAKEDAHGHMGEILEKGDWVD
ncbi:hypothetical protein JCM24511_03337 [Saitozyma sp. JCM 24511]|nr:hypothetical protein JCM24511_03337 [Saitozyma sp. JCM 24511]